MHTTQRQCALEQKPSATCLEQVAHLMKVDRSAVDELIEQLETHCVVCYCAVLNVRRYGDNFVLQKREVLIVQDRKTFSDNFNTVLLMKQRTQLLNGCTLQH